MANWITGLRMVCGLGLLFCPLFSPWFYGLYLAGGISDVLDGFAARHLGTESRLGAQLDTAADMVFCLAVIVKLVGAMDFPKWLIGWIAFIALIKCINLLSGFVMYKRFVAEHTGMNKVCGVLLFAVPLCLGLLPGPAARALIVLTCGAATAAAVQEGHYIRTGREVS